MNEAVKITIEEWAAEYGLQVNDEQIHDLMQALSICSDMEIVCHIEKVNSYLNNLENKIRMLEQFIRDKGYTITVQSNGIMEHVHDVTYGVSHVGISTSKVFHSY